MARRKRALEGEIDFPRRAQRVRISRTFSEAEQVCQFARAAGVRARCGFRLTSRLLNVPDERAAVLDVKFQAGRRRRRKARGATARKRFCSRQILVGLAKSTGIVAVVQRIVDELDVFAQAENLFAGSAAATPSRSRGCKGSRLRRRLLCLDHRPRASILAELADFAEDRLLPSTCAARPRRKIFRSRCAAAASGKIKFRSRRARQAGRRKSRMSPGRTSELASCQLTCRLFVPSPKTAFAVGRFHVGFFQRAQQVNCRSQFGSFRLHDGVAFRWRQNPRLPPCRHDRTFGETRAS